MKPHFSYWEKEEILQNADLAIIGGGIVGIFTAYFYRKSHPKARIIILERSAIGFGGTSRNAGFACFGSPSEVLSDLRAHGADAVSELVSMRYRGLQQTLTLLKPENIGYEPCGSKELFFSNDPLYQSCMDQLDELNSLMTHTIGASPYSNTSPEQGMYGFTNAISNELEGSIHTGRLVLALRKLLADNHIDLFTGMEVKQLAASPSHVAIHTLQGVFNAQRVAVCTNGFARQLLPNADVHAARNLVLVTDPIEHLNWKGTFHLKEGYFYFRTIANRILLGGGRHLDRTWKSDPEGAVPQEVRDALLQLLYTHIAPGKEMSIAHEWVGYLGIGQERLPIIQQFHDRIFVGVRMGGMGVAIGSEVGRKLADLM